MLAGQAKTASRRVIPISDNLAAWLAPLRRRGRVVPSCRQHREITALAKSLGIPWPRNVLRHSFISYRIAIVKSADQVALEAGNSPAIIFRHYRELTTEETAKEWFGIGPRLAAAMATQLQTENLAPTEDSNARRPLTSFLASPRQRAGRSETSD
jgi:hypothetical protein